MTRSVKFVLHPTIIITIIITRGTSLFLLSVDSQVAIDHLDVPGLLNVAPLLLLLVLPVGGLLPQSGVLLPQLLDALLWLLEGMLITITSSCSEAFSMGICTTFPHHAEKHF